MLGTAPVKRQALACSDLSSLDDLLARLSANYRIMEVTNSWTPSTLETMRDSAFQDESVELPIEPRSVSPDERMAVNRVKGNNFDKAQQIKPVNEVADSIHGNPLTNPSISLQDTLDSFNLSRWTRCTCSRSSRASANVSASSTFP